jgi:hypothetical protein
MSSLVAAVGIVTLLGAVILFAVGDRIEAVDCLVISGLSFAVWGVTRRRPRRESSDTPSSGTV